MKTSLLKTAFITLLFSTASLLSMAQWAGSTDSTGITYRFGNVGIGTSNPSSLLDLHAINPYIY